MWASELGVVATSNNSWQWHGQLQWMWLKPSPIAMVVINVIIVRRRSAHETSLSNAMRKAMAISLKATRRPCQQMQQEHLEGVVSITTIFILRWQLLSQERQSLQCKHSGCKKETLYAGNLRQILQIHAPDLPQWTWDQQQNIQKRSRKQKKKQSHRDTNAMCHARWLLDKPRIESLGRASDTIPSDNRTSTSNDNKNYHFVSNPKMKRMLDVRCSGLATATSSQVQSAKNISDGFSQQGCLYLKLDARILLRCIVTSSLKMGDWFQ